MTFGQANFPNSNAIWNVYLECPNKGDELYGITGDTVLNNIAYSIVCVLNDTIIVNSMDNAKPVGFIRNESQKVLFRPKNGNVEEFVLYDFSKSVGDTIWHNASLVLLDGGSIIAFDSAKYISVILEKFEENDLVKYNVQTGLYDSEFGFLYPLQSDWIQGVGSTKGLFWHLYTPPMVCENNNSLKCLKHNDSIKYLNDTRCDKCFCSYLASINEKKYNQDQIIIFPNPSNKNITFHFGELNIEKIQINDCSGRLCDVLDCNKQYDFLLLIDKYQSGIYFYIATSKQGVSYTGKFVVQ